MTAPEVPLPPPQLQPAADSQATTLPWILRPSASAGICRSACVFSTADITKSKWYIVSLICERYAIS